ncbi:hypothetical protein OC846_003087 [Tilletia horrida]|uniref:Uncharacterized protein n=1 Tax=Tilletia horrida TaxID=155126 RepID=A0AAN6JS31_9BASI|nr:hypothetical protein OC845_002798 [Tilletia horrida]KAK0552003.1 hypothetical protein OC846_003087 [Tilletia horrida]KAK0566152.1 hypothetical protein OC861_003373 [Tilletia horrida]
MAAVDQNAAGSSINDDLAPVLVAPASASRFPSFVAHLMPFHMSYDGPAPIDIFLVFDIEQSVTTPGKSVVTSAFRGRKLYGTPLELPANWSAAVVLKPTALEKEQAFKVKERQLQRNRQAEVRAQKKSELSEVRRAEFEQRKEQRRAEREAAREAHRAEQIALRAEQQAARAAAVASGQADPDADLGPEPLDMEDEEEEDFDDENDLLEDLHFFEGALDDSADEYLPSGRRKGDDEDEEDADEAERARKKPRPRPRPRARGVGASSALSTGGLSASLTTTENPLGLQPPPQLESLSTLSRFQQAVAATAQQSFSMDDDDDEDADHDVVDEEAFNAGLDPTRLPAATQSDDMVLPADHQREQGDILDHSVVAIHASVDVEMDALAIAAARAAHTDKADEDEEADDGAYDDDADGEEADEDNDDDDNGATGSTSAYFGRGGGSLVGGGLFDKIKGRRDAAAGSSSRTSLPSQTTRTSPRRLDRGSLVGPSSTTASPISRTAQRSGGGSQKPDPASNRLGRQGRSQPRGTPFEDDVIPGSDEEEDDSNTANSKAGPNRSEDDASLSPAQRRSARHNADEDESRTSTRTTRSSPRKHRSSSQSSPGKNSDKVVYGTGEAAAAARRAQEAEENRRKSSRKAPPPKRFVDDDIPVPTASKYKTNFSKQAKVKAEKDSLKRSASSSSLAKNAAASGANAMKRWLSGAGSAIASASKSKSTPSPSKTRNQAAFEDADDDSEEEELIGPSSGARTRQRNDDDEVEIDEVDEPDGEGGQGSEWEKESPKDRSRRLSAAPMEVVIKTADRKSLDSEGSAGIWRRSESVSPRKAKRASSPSESPSSTRRRTAKSEHTVPLAPKRIVTSVTSSGRVALRPTRYSLSPEPVVRKSHRKKVTKTFPSEDEDEDNETATDASADIDEGDTATDQRRGTKLSAGGATAEPDADAASSAQGGAALRKRIWAKRWTFEERIDVMLGDSKSYSPLHTGSSAALQKTAKKRAAKEAVMEGQVKLRVAGRLSTAAPPASLVADESGEEKRAAWGTSGVLVWNADGEVDDGDDPVVRTVQELLGVWAMIHDY